MSYIYTVYVLYQQQPKNMDGWYDGWMDGWLDSIIDGWI